MTRKGWYKADSICSWCHSLLCNKHHDFPTAGRKSRTIQLGPIYEALGPGSFAGKGKHAFWKAFQDSSEGILTVLINLWTTNQLQDDTAASLEQFICTVYQPQTQIVLLKKLRWWLFKKKQAESERLPPSPDALRQANLRAHHLTIIWNLDTVPQPVIPLVVYDLSGRYSTRRYLINRQTMQ